MTTIRPATPADAAELAVLSAETFSETFTYYPPEDLAAYLAEAYTEEGYTHEITSSDYGIWVAEQEGSLIGYVVAGSAHLPHPELSEADGEIRRLYVRSNHQGQGLGSQLLEQALQWLLKDNHQRTLWLGVWSENYGAQRLYQRYGFERVGDYYFEVGKTRDFEFILRRLPH
ncbi:GNAT family N-acetyltransferase [Rothia nasimurium]|uniref:GNAT family N-acetyltransferase n=1 Tax=Rothia nasimurium TaxID=85336 RepID=UPI001F2DDBC2|nr:N-acetyltransferase [Rothia nasimurium]